MTEEENIQNTNAANDTSHAESIENTALQPPAQETETQISTSEIKTMEVHHHTHFGYGKKYRKIISWN